MNSIFRSVIVFTFVLGLSSTYICKALWACDREDGHSCHKMSKHAVQTKTEGKGKKAMAVKDKVCGIEVCDIEKTPCCIGQLTLQWTRVWRLAISERNHRKGTKGRFTTSARNTV
ncbi:MAG: hypothetical protein QG591_1037 [Planctomycetota bacterium]|nr:hypothetical protein [Planctomycetota bacterium]